jgi:hydrogenase maturation factor HypF (carbamoyltransferase family)
MNRKSMVSSGQALIAAPIISASRWQTVPVVICCTREAARAVANAALDLAAAHQVNHVVLSGGVFQNTLLSSDIMASLSGTPVRVLTNSAVPPNDGGISLGQAAIAALWRSGCTEAAHGDS